jgi:hypothetical protein
MSPDLKLATIYVMPLGGRDTDAVIAALDRNKKFLRGEIAHRVNLKFAPDLRFRVDDHEQLRRPQHGHVSPNDPRVLLEPGNRFRFAAGSRIDAARCISNKKFKAYRLIGDREIYIPPSYGGMMAKMAKYRVVRVVPGELWCTHWSRHTHRSQQYRG